MATSLAITARSIRRQVPHIAVVAALDANGERIRPRKRHIETDWKAGNTVPRGRGRSRWEWNKAQRKQREAVARARALADNRQRIATLKTQGLALPGQTPEQAQAIRSMQRR